MMICPKCLCECEKDSNFCDQCGHLFDAVNPPFKKRLRKIPYEAFADFKQRASAWILDGFVLLVMAAICATIFKDEATPLTRAMLRHQISRFDILISLLYYPLMESFSLQGTLGKLSFGIKVTDLARNRISFARASARQCGRFLTGCTLGIGYLMTLWTENKQTLHDKISGCVVIKAPGLT